MLKTIKKCSKCGEDKQLDQFHNNRSQKDGLHYYCKKCVVDKQREYNHKDDKLTEFEQSTLLKYLPYAHERGSFICRNTKGEAGEDAQPITLMDIAEETGIGYSEAQRIYYKAARLNLITLVIKSDGKKGLNTLIHYKKDNIKDYIFNDKELTSVD